MGGSGVRQIDEFSDLPMSSPAMRKYVPERGRLGPALQSSSSHFNE